MFIDISILFKVFFNICRLRIGPQDLPKSNELLIVCLIVYTLLDIIFVLLSEPLIDAVLAGFIETFLLMLMTFAILRIHNTSERWTQTVTALSGTGFLLGLIALPVFYGITVDNADQAFKSILLIFYTLLILWNIAIIAHILRYAIDTTFGFGILLAIGYIMITAIVIVIMLPDQGIS